MSGVPPARNVFKAEPRPVYPPTTERLAIAALVIGVLSVLGTIALLGVLLGPLAVIFGFLARRRVMSSDGELRGGRIAMIGLVLGVVGSVLSLLLLVALSGMHGIANFY